MTESPVPEVQTDRVFFDVNRHVGPLHDCNETTATEGVAQVTCTFEGTVWASDPRLSGPVRGSLHEFGWEGDGPAISTELHVIENEGGTWRGTRQVVEARETIEWQGKPVLVLSGEGGYAGLTAAIFLRGEGAGVGVILPVPIPEPAEPEDPQPTPAAE